MSLVITACLGLAGCSGLSGGKDIFDPEKHDLYDKRQRLSREDYRQMARPEVDDLRPRFEGEATTKVELGEPPIPDVSQVLAAPRPPGIGENKMVSIFVTEDVPLKDVLIELARLADVDVEIDANIQGGIVFRAQNRPFSEVVDRISKLAGLRYDMKGGTLKFMRDFAEVKTYTLDFLSFDRSSTSDMNISTAVLSSSGGSGALNSGSGAQVSYTSEGDFWAQLEAAVESILAYRRGSNIAQPTDATSGGAATTGADESFFVINRQAGTITISGTSYHHQMLDSYLNQLRDSVSAQVLIEAKIIEVTLDEQFQSGIDWTSGILKTKMIDITGSYDAVENTGQNITTMLLSDKEGSLDAVVNFTEQFGTTRTLSSPRIHAMNNQQAILTFARNVVYFEIDVEEEVEPNDSGPDTRTYTFDSEPVTIPVGIILSLQPSINMKTQEVSLSVRPTLSRIAEFKVDPVVTLLLTRLGDSGDDTNIQNLIPEIEVRELDSLVRMKSGQVMVLGGLMEQVGANSEGGIPYVSSIPWVGNAFKGVNRTEGVKELYFLVKATIVGNTSTVTPEDKNMYRKFTTDHRPLAF